jgi:hypothetical protein
MANSGVGSQAGGAKETTWGTAVTPTKFWEYESESLNLDQNYYDGMGLVAGRTFAPSSRGKKTTRSAGGDLAMTFPYKGGGFFLDQMVAGTITPVQQGATAAYLSTFNVGSSVPSKSATLQINKPQTSGGDVPFTYPGAVLVSAGFSMALGGALMATFTWLCKDETTPTTTPAGASLATATYIANNDIWLHQDMTLTYGGAAVAGINSVSWTWSQPYADGRFFLDGSGTISKPFRTVSALSRAPSPGTGTTARFTRRSEAARTPVSCARRRGRPLSRARISRCSVTRSQRSRCVGRARPSAARICST